MKKIKDSNYWEPLLKHYIRTPSIALCRVPELELFSKITIEHPVLDHCCGDGFITKIVFPNAIIDAGFDIEPKKLARARQRGNYLKLKQGDAGVSLPFPKKSFATVINNSGIEHILDLDRALSEIARVLKTEGKVYLNVLNRRYFDRWPLPPETADSYRGFQPFYHALDEAGWCDCLKKNGFTDIAFKDYLPEKTSKILSEIDYRYSAFYFRKKIFFSLAFERLLPTAWLIKKWRDRLENLEWQSQPGLGSGFLITARKDAV